MPRENSTPIWLPGIHAYAEKSVAAGEIIHFRVGSDTAYQLSIAKLGADADSPAQDEEIFKFLPSVPNQQPIHPGSYVNIEPSIPAYQALSALTLECWIRPWALDSWQGIFTQYTTPDACGFGLFITSEGKAAFYIGDGGQLNGDNFFVSHAALKSREWHHLVGVWDGEQVSLWVNGELDHQQVFNDVVKPGLAPLRLAAYGENRQTSHFLDGDLSMPVIYDRGLTPSEIQERYKLKALETPDFEGVLGCWPLWEERGDQIEDVSVYRRHGQIVNEATWMIGGPSFNHESVPRFGNYDPEEDTRRGHGLRFASDDLYDCGWGVSHTYRIPEDAKPGIYVGRFRFGADFLYDVTFVVRKAASRPKAKMLVLCATSTWLAYNATSFAVNNTSTEYRQYWGTNGRENSHPAAPAYSCYRSHRHGQPTSKMGLQMPWPDAQPYMLYSPQNLGYSHLMRGERFTHIWLDQQGYDYDVVTDFDLHRDPSILDHYDVFMMIGHSEYWSIPAYKGLEVFLHRGGKLIVLSGNTMFWRVSFDDDLTVMECHKLDGIPGGDTPIGEIFHSHDGLRGNLMRECGYPAYDLIGMESVGFWNNDKPQAYTCMTPDFFLFKFPNDVGLTQGAKFAKDSVGHEWDVRVSQMEPDGLPYEQAGMTLLGQCKRGDDDTIWDYFMRRVDGDAVISEMIYWDRPKGGQVFYAGSIGAGWGLAKDPAWSAIMQNVLHHFEVSPGR